jgi:hypothetical protein
VRVFDFHQVRRAVVLEPGADAHAGQALGDELQLAVFAAGVVHLHQRAVLGRAEVSKWRGSSGRVHEEQGQGVVRDLLTSSRVSAQGSSLTITGSTCAGKNGRLWIGMM